MRWTLPMILSDGPRIMNIILFCHLHLFRSYLFILTDIPQRHQCKVCYQPELGSVLFEWNVRQSQALEGEQDQGSETDQETHDKALPVKGKRRNLYVTRWRMFANSKWGTLVEIQAESYGSYLYLLIINYLIFSRLNGVRVASLSINRLLVIAVSSTKILAG